MQLVAEDYHRLHWLVDLAYGEIQREEPSMSVHDPSELSSLFAERASRGDLEGLLELYEPQATLVAPDGEPVTGEEAIRRLLGNLLAAAPWITPLDARQTLRSEDIALLLTRWQMTLGGEDGPAMEGSSTEVARRQADGSWAYVLDRPVIESIEAAAASPGSLGEENPRLHAASLRRGRAGRADHFQPPRAPQRALDAALR